MMNKKKCRTPKKITLWQRWNCKKDWVSSGRENKKQYYVQEDTKFIQNQKNMYHAKLLLYYPWHNEDDIISPFTTYHESYINKQDIIHQNAQKFNEDCEAFDVDLKDLENNIPQSAWEMVAPNIGQDDTITHLQGFSTLQHEEIEQRRYNRYSVWWQHQKQKR